MVNAIRDMLESVRLGCGSGQPMGVKNQSERWKIPSMLIGQWFLSSFSPVFFLQFGAGEDCLGNKPANHPTESINRNKSLRLHSSVTWLQDSSDSVAFRPGGYWDRMLGSAAMCRCCGKCPAAEASSAPMGNSCPGAGSGSARPGDGGDGAADGERLGAAGRGPRSNAIDFDDLKVHRRLLVSDKSVVHKSAFFLPDLLSPLPLPPCLPPPTAKCRSD